MGQDVVLPWYRHRGVVRLVDISLAAGAGGLAVLIAAARSVPAGERHFGSPVVLTAALLLLSPAALLVRRRFPVGALIAVVAATGSIDLLVPHPIPPLCALVALTAVTAARPPRLSVWAAVVVGLLSLSDLVADTRPDLVLSGFWLISVALAWAVGEVLRARTAELDALRGLARNAAAEEQARIARELHDVIAHNVSVMVVQAAAAGEVFDSQPHRARSALSSIEETGRTALVELRRLLGAVRGPEPGARAPQPGLASLPELVDKLRAAGLPVALEVQGESAGLPAGVDLNAYRIVQEALTNTLRHANASSATVRVAHSGDRVVLEVVDDGQVIVHLDDRSPGNGLAGMRERAALIGGELQYGARPGGGFAVRAELPTGTAAQ